MYLVSKIYRAVLPTLFFINCTAMVKHEQVGIEQPKPEVSINELTQSILQRLQRNPNLLFIKPNDQQDPVIYSLLTRDAYAPLLESLLKHKALDKNSEIMVGSEKYPLIIFALAHQAKSAVQNMRNIEVLLAAEPDLNISSVNPNAVLSNCTPLSLSIENENPHMVELILKSYEAQEKKFRLPGVFDKGIVNASYANLRLPLMQTVDRVCLSNNPQRLLEIAKILLRYNADPYAKDSYGARLGNANITYMVDTPYELAEGRSYQNFVTLFENFVPKRRNSH